MNTHIIKSINIVSRYEESIKDFSNNWNNDFNILCNYIVENHNIDCSIDQSVIKPFSRDWSNIPGHADILFRPKNEIECAIIIKNMIIMSQRMLQLVYLWE